MFRKLPLKGQATELFFEANVFNFEAKESSVVIGLEALG